MEDDGSSHMEFLRARFSVADTGDWGVVLVPAMVLTVWMGFSVSFSWGGGACRTG